MIFRRHSADLWVSGNEGITVFPTHGRDYFLTLLNTSYPHEQYEKAATTSMVAAVSSCGNRI